MQEEAANSLPMNTCCEKCQLAQGEYAPYPLNPSCRNPNCECHQYTPTHEKTVYEKMHDEVQAGIFIPKGKLFNIEIEGWEKDYDKLTGLVMVGTAHTYPVPADYQAIKGFIKLQLYLALTHQQERIVQKLEGMKLAKEPVLMGSGIRAPSHLDTWESGYNAALTEAIEVVKNNN